MSQFYTLLTTTGQELLTQAMGFGQQLELTEMAVGDGGGSVAPPSEDKTALANEVYRSGVSSLVVDAENPNWLVAELVIPTDVGGWTIREIGLFDIDGNLFAVGNFPETYKPTLAAGSGREITVRMTIQVSDTASVTLTVDQSVVFATRTFVASAVADHAASRDHPSATTTAHGFVELATDSETIAGTDASRAITPAGLSARTATTSRKGLVEMATSQEAVTGSDTQRAVTPAGVKQHVDTKLSSYGKSARVTSYFMGQN